MNLPSRTTLPSYWVDPTPDVHSAPLTAGWHRDLHALASVLFATAQGLPPDARLNWTVRQIDDILGNIRGRGAFVYRLSVAVVSWLAPFFVFRLPTFRRLSQDQRILALERFEQSPLGLMLFAIKALLCIAYYEHPDAAEEISFDGRGLLETQHG